MCMCIPVSRLQLCIQIENIFNLFTLYCPQLCMCMCILFVRTKIENIFNLLPYIVLNYACICMCIMFQVFNYYIRLYIQKYKTYSIYGLYIVLNNACMCIMFQSSTITLYCTYKNRKRIQSIAFVLSSIMHVYLYPVSSLQLYYIVHTKIENIFNILPLIASGYN